MADTKISAMPAAATLDSTELIPLVQGGSNVQTTALNVVNQTIQAFPSTARTSLGLGTMALQNSNNVSISGGAITGIQDLAVADGGTGASTYTAGYLKANGTTPFTTVATIPYSDITGGPVGNLYYGSFYDTTTQSAAAIDTAYAMKFNTNVINNKGITIANNGSGDPTRITFANAGTYNIQFSAQLDSVTGSTQTAEIWFAKNGVADSYSSTIVTVQGTTAETVAAWNYWVTVTAGQYYEIFWAADNTGIKLTSTTPTGIYPGVPSVILTVNQVA
jgi:uncharacterized membrane protein